MLGCCVVQWLGVDSCVFSIPFLCQCVRAVCWCWCYYLCWSACVVWVVESVFSQGWAILVLRSGGLFVSCAVFVLFDRM